MFRLLIDLVSAILLLSGAGTIEDLSADEVEHFYQLAERPLAINILPKRRLLASGIFSLYQVEAIEEYRKNSGDILSLSEFALVDGVGKMYAEALSYFVSFESSHPPGQRESNTIREAFMIRGSGQYKGGSETLKLSAKYHIQIGEKAELFLSSQPKAFSSATKLQNSIPPGSLSLAFYGRRGGKLLFGDFAARFGQGLALWTGLSMTGFSSVEAFRKNPSGFCATGSFNPTLSGLASDFVFGSWTISAGLSIPALRRFLSAPSLSIPQPSSSPSPPTGILALTHYGTKGQFGLQALYTEGLVLSADGLLGLEHWTLFGEAALSSKQLVENNFTINRTRLAGLCAVSWAPAYQVKATALVRYYPSGFYSPFAGAVRSFSAIQDQRGFALAAKWRWVELTADASTHPSTKSCLLKTILSLKPNFTLWGLSVAPSLRWTERASGTDAFDWKHELRGDLSISSGSFLSNFRAHLVSTQHKTGHLAYLELGFKPTGRAYSESTSAKATMPYAAPSSPSKPKASPTFSAYVRATLFNTPDWDTRIYCYERDLPGSFSVPPLYTRGCRFSTLLGLKGSTGRRFRYGVYLKASLTRYLAQSHEGSNSANNKTSPIKAPVTELKLQLQTSF